MSDLAAQLDEALRAAYRYAYAARKCALENRSHKAFDARGVHPFSEEIGRIEVLEELLGLAAQERADPRDIKDRAAQRAAADYVEGYREAA